MKKTIFISSLLLLFLTSIASAQKVKIKKGTVSINKQPMCKIEKDKSVGGAFYINSLDNEEFLYLKWIDWGQYGYFEIYKADDLNNILFEEEAGIGFRKWIVKKLYNAEVITSSGFNEEKLQILSKKVGKEFSRRRRKY